MSLDLKISSMWDLAYNLDPTNIPLCKDIDKYLAIKIIDLDSLYQIYYYLCYGDMHTLLPHTKKQINTLLLKKINTNNLIEWHQFKNFINWLDEDIKLILAKIWLDNNDINLNNFWMAGSIPKDAETSLKMLSKLIKIYKKKKSTENIKLMGKIFLSLDSKRVNEACEMLVKSTPAAIVTMLKRKDINDKYTIKGLKALSKLSKQRDLNIKIDFNMLKHLGPKSRLDAMKQLMGMFDAYYVIKQKNKKLVSSSYNYKMTWKEKQLIKTSKQYNLPFKKMPSHDDIKIFLFPCCIKYNDEVVAMIERFDELIN